MISHNVIELASKDRVEEAWKALRDHNSKIIVDDPHVLVDREFIQRQIELHDRFRRLYLAWCRK